MATSSSLGKERAAALRCGNNHQKWLEKERKLSWRVELELGGCLGEGKTLLRCVCNASAAFTQPRAAG